MRVNSARKTVHSREKILLLYSIVEGELIWDRACIAACSILCISQRGFSLGLTYIVRFCVTRSLVVLLVVVYLISFFSDVIIIFEKVQ